MKIEQIDKEYERVKNLMDKIETWSSDDVNVGTELNVLKGWAGNILKFLSTIQTFHASEKEEKVWIKEEEFEEFQQNVNRLYMAAKDIKKRIKVKKN
ncbi:MAG: hypothetical protein JSW00_09665 [Thermoplasmata archaeon]|nr:MAG: hypothetical protein JSW00_09665 [Thermoplasmata archaeon]